MDGSEVRGKRFSILGGGRSGVAAARLLRKHEAAVFLSDRSPLTEKKPEADDLQRLGITTEFGGHTERVLEADSIVLSPGVPDSIPVVREAAKRAIPVLSEIELAARFCAVPIIAVTGTNGKTTTTVLIGRMLTDAGLKPVVAGNIGIAFSGMVDDLKPDNLVVLEVSSFQLDHIRMFRPRVSVLLNITPDHLDRYEGSFERYVASKGRLFMNQRGGDSVVFNGDDPAASRCVEEAAAGSVERHPFSIEREVDNGAFLRDGAIFLSSGDRWARLIAADELGVRGIHNTMNAMAAVLASLGMKARPASLRGTLKSFRGVEHRLEEVRVLNGITYVNDSKATNVDSVRYALQSFTTPIVLLLGGRDKGNDYGKLRDLVRSHVRSIVAIGESAAKVAEAFAGVVNVSQASTMNDAVAAAMGAAQPGDIVLLSPACASFDWFDNYEHRGNVFKELVRSL